MPDPDYSRALRVLRALYVIVREPYRDGITDAVAAFGTRLDRALAERDTREARAVLAEISEWLLRMRHIVSTRLESNFSRRGATLPIGRRDPDA